MLRAGALPDTERRGRGIQPLRALRLREEGEAVDKLKPCPYCGSERVEMKRYHDLFGVECNDCKAGLGPRPVTSWTYYVTKEAAVKKWNWRG